MALIGKTVAKRAAAGLGGLVLAFGAFIGTLQLTGNFHEVIAGDFYRAGQPSVRQIAAYQKNYGIKTIINLRGDNPGVPWYMDEVAESQSLGITHIDFGMSAGEELTPARTAELLKILRDAPRPIMVHCEGGADRSGLVSVIYLQQIAKVDEEVAERQLSLRYGHVAIPYVSRSFAMDESWEKLEKVFGLES